ncbi:MAG: DEAD/DEAH box helicase family protein [Bacteroidia bacterium]|nr:DEAD/DEAH box helicase family protein [Bacteroidia bacterium]
MTEDDTRADYIDPKLREVGWDNKTVDVKIHRNYPITLGKIKATGGRGIPIRADYLLTYKTRKMAVVEAKAYDIPVGEGVAQAKNYAEKLQVDDAYASNGREIYHIDMDSAQEGLRDKFHTPDELWNKAFPKTNEWQDKFDSVPYEDKGGSMGGRFYQDIAVERTLDAIANKQNRILLTLATGTGKTFIAFQIAWKLFHTRWNTSYEASRRPRILFLADRNILADQAYNAFSAFPEDALVRIRPSEIKKKGKVPTNGSIFFTIFQTFMSGPNDTPYFGEYPKDYFDFIIIDECHRGGANDESTWRGIMEYFSPAVQIGLTATPKRRENADTYKYFGKPVFIYSLKDGIEDGFLTPFKVRQIKTSLDEYTYKEEDQVLEGDIDKERTYTESDFNRIIEIKAREEKRVRLLMDMLHPDEKTLVFCANQDHAAAIRDLINQYKKSKETKYCVRVTANDGELGEQYLREFQDNEKSLPTVLTTSYKLSTGVDARNVRNIVLLRPVNNIIEFKQIVGRGTRLFDDKNFFTIYDFVNASERFKDPEWDGEPVEPVITDDDPNYEPEEARAFEDPEAQEERERKARVKIKLGSGKEHQITHHISTTFIGPDGKPLTLQEFLDMLYGKIPEFFRNEEELRRIWSQPDTRKALLDQLEGAGFGVDELKTLQKVIDAEKCDLFDVLEYIVYSAKPLTRERRVAGAQRTIFSSLEPAQKEFIEFVLDQYIQSGVEELDQEKLPVLLELKYQSVSDATEKLGGVSNIRDLFINFQKELYREGVA